MEPPACYAALTYTVPLGTVAANTWSNISGVEAGGGSVSQIDFNVTSAPAVIDLDISGSNNAVSAPNPTPSALMVGQQVQLQAYPTTGITSVQWNFDSAALSDVVGSYNTSNAQTMLTPAPVTTTLPRATPNTFYWVSSGSPAKHVYIIAYATGVQGPLLTDVYYPISTLSTYSATATTTSAGSKVGSYGIVDPSDPDEYEVNCSPSPPPNEVSFDEAIHLGNQCKPHGINWTYTATAPQNGAGVIALVQLINFSATYYEGSASVSYNYYNTFQLDGSFPYYNVPGHEWATLSAGGSANLNILFDAPATLLVGLTCTQVARNDSFVDYFVYKANATTNRPSIPAAIANMPWSWGGLATAISSGKNWTGSGLSSPPTTLSSTASTQLPYYLANNNTLLAAIPPNPCATL
ncbi:MAG: hypothetical protein WAK16_11285 [Candidatus Cybelea sp.]